jgi:hypothetical protein
MTTQTLGKEGVETLRSGNPSYRLREVDQTAPAGMWSMGAQGADMLFQASTAADWSAFTDVVTLASTPAVTIHGTLTVSGTIVFEDNVRLDDDIIVAFGDDSDYYMGYSATDDALEIGTGATIASNVALSVDSSGKVGIGGTPGSTYFFQVKPRTTTYTAGGVIEHVNVNAGATTIDGYTASHALGIDFETPNFLLTGGGAITNASTVYIGGAPTEATNNYALWVNAGASRFDGDVGIGGTPDETLHLQDSSQYTILKIERSTATASDAIVQFTSSSGNDWVAGVIGSLHSGRDWSLYDYQGTPGIRLHVEGSTGYVGIGTTSPTALLTLDGGDLDMSNGEILNVGAADNEWTANRVNLEGSNTGATSELRVYNTDNSDVASRARVTIVAGGASAGDPHILMAVAGGVSNFTIGIDNPEGQLGVISRGSSLGTDDSIHITDASPPILSYNAVHPTGVFDYICGTCGANDAAPFVCHGEAAEWHDDVMDFRAMALRKPGALDYMERVGVIQRPLDNDGNKQIFTVLGRDFEFSMSAVFQNRQRMDAHYDELDGRLRSLESAHNAHNVISRTTR